MGKGAIFMNWKKARTRYGWVATLCAGVAACNAHAGDDPALPPDTFTPSLVYDGAAGAVLRGGQSTGSTYAGILHLRLQAKAPPGSDWAGTSALVDVRTLHGGHPSARVGDAQGVSNIEGPDGTDIHELWVQHNFQQANLSLLAGIYDLNSEFYRLQAAGLFLNSSFGIGPEFAQSGVEGPSIFPRTSAGVRLSTKPAPGVVVRGALLDGVPVVRPDGTRGVFRAGDGWLGVGEVAFLSRSDEADDDHSDVRQRQGRFSALPPYQDKLAFGLWRYSGKLPAIDAAPSDPAPAMRRSSGAYAIGEWRIIGREPSPSRTLSAFAQVGTASSATNRFGSYIGAGLVGTGWIPGRDADQIGLSVASARNGAAYARSQSALGQAAAHAETTIEASYLMQLTKWLTLQPDLQYVIHPDTQRSLANAWVVQLRFELSF
jgi:porin